MFWWWVGILYVIRLPGWREPRPWGLASAWVRIWSVLHPHLGMVGKWRSLPGIVLRSKAITPVPGHAKHTADAGCYFIFVYVNGCLQNDVQLYGDTSLFMHLWLIDIWNVLWLIEVWNVLWLIELWNVLWLIELWNVLWLIDIWNVPAWGHYGFFLFYLIYLCFGCSVGHVGS